VPAASPPPLGASLGLPNLVPHGVSPKHLQRYLDESASIALAETELFIRGCAVPSTLRLSLSPLVQALIARLRVSSVGRPTPRFPA
jgi:hypothetical protein